MQDELNAMQPAATSHVRGPPGFVARLYGSALAFSLLAFLSFVSVAGANPTGGTVTNGSANIVTSGTTLDINQSTQRAVINWQSFNIAPNETTKFNQPSSSSVTLNRIDNSNPSQILGTLTANGNVVLINPNGVFFGSGSKVDVNGLIATTANIRNADFMAGNMNFSVPGNPNASVVNQGTITAKDAGLVGLVAPNIINSGTINAKLGRVHLDSGDMFTMDMYGDGLIEVGVSAAVQRQVVTQSGQINAAGGTIQLTAAAGRNMVNSLISVPGKLNAPAAQQRGGEIIISATGSNGTAKTGSSAVVVSGTLNASGYGAGQTGGTVNVTGDHVTLKPGTVIDASGAAGGGTVNIGGNLHGQGLLAKAVTTTIESNTQVRANAITSGNGGQVTVWSGDQTAFDGNIEARGGAGSGNGGIVETSSHGVLSVGGIADTSSPHGTGGEWLLDPASLTISSAADANTAGCPNCTPDGTVTTSNLSTGTIDTALNAGTNVTVTTGGDVAANAGDITVNNAIVATGAGSLTLSSYRDIVLNAGITLAGGALTLRADNAGTGSGFINIAGAISTAGGNVTMGGGAGPITASSGYAVGNAAGQVAGIVDNGVAISAAGGNIIINGQGFNTTTSNNYGVEINAGTISTTGAGTVSISGQGSGNANSGFNYGVYVTGSAAVSSVNGALTINGAGGSGSGSNYGILNNGTISSTGNAAITLTGIGGGSGAGGFDIGIVNRSTISSSGNAAITLTGIGGGSGAGGFDYGIDNLGGTITSTATGGGGITLIGYGGDKAGGGGSNYGILNSAGTITSIDGNILLNGNAGLGLGNFTTDTGGFDIGIFNNGGTISSTGNAAITLNGVGAGSGAGANNYGVYITSSNGIQTTGTGSIIVTGAGSSSSGGNNDGVSLVGGSITGASGQNILINATSGSSAGAYGFSVDAASTVNAMGAGNLTIVTDTDNFGAASTLTTGSGRWLVYSVNPLNNNDALLANNFVRYSCTYGGACPAFPAAGNGFLYSITPTLTIAPSGIASIVYGSAVPNLTGYAYTISGYRGSDGAADVVSGSVNGGTVYTSASNIGTYDINYASGALSSTLGYGFSYANNASAFTVTPKGLTVTANNLSKTFGTVYSFLGSEFAAAGLINGDTVSSVSLASPGAAAGAGVAGSPYAITASSAVGTGLANYGITYNNGVLSVVTTLAHPVTVPGAVVVDNGGGIKTPHSSSTSAAAIDPCMATAAQDTLPNQLTPMLDLVETSSELAATLPFYKIRTPSYDPHLVCGDSAPQPQHK